MRNGEPRRRLQRKRASEQKRRCGSAPDEHCALLHSAEGSHSECGQTAQWNRQQCEQHKHKRRCVKHKRLSDSCDQSWRTAQPRC